MEGLRFIIDKVAIRRMEGLGINTLVQGREGAALDASQWEVLSLCFSPTQPIVTCIPGALFPLLAICPLVVYWHDYRANALDVRIPVLWILFFMAATSWYVLAKGHSYVHPHLDYVLWYFGFVQICAYTLIDRFARWVRQGPQGNVESRDTHLGEH